MAALLSALSNDEIDWLTEAGRFKEVSPGTVLVEPNQPSDFYILLAGNLAVSFVHPASKDAWEFDKLSLGEIFGTAPWLESSSGSTAMTALTPCTVLEISLPQMAEKIGQDSAFTARFCQAHAIQMLKRLNLLLYQFGSQIHPQAGLNAAAAVQSQMRDALTVFAELQDSDLDWMLAVGQVQTLAADTVLVRQGRPFDALHILLEGALTLHTAETSDWPSDDLRTAFVPYSSPEVEVARLSRGDLVGELSLVNSSLSPFTIRASRDSQVFSIPQWRLAAKLLHDVEFAARFYRVLALLIAQRQEIAMRRYFSGNSVSNGTMNSTSDSQFLARVELAEARFEWMQMRIQTQFGMERQLQW